MTNQPNANQDMKFNMQHCANFMPLPAEVTKQTGVRYVSYYNEELHLIKADKNEATKWTIPYYHQTACPVYLTITYCNQKIYLANVGHDTISELDGIQPQKFKQLRDNIDTLTLTTLGNRMYYTSAGQEDFNNKTYEILYEEEEKIPEADDPVLKQNVIAQLSDAQGDDRFNNLPAYPEQLVIKHNVKTLCKIVKEGFKEELLIDYDSKQPKEFKFASDQSPVLASGYLVYWGINSFDLDYEKEFAVVNCLGQIKMFKKADYTTDWFKGEDQTTAKSGMDDCHLWMEMGEFGLKFPDALLLKWFDQQTIDAVAENQRKFFNEIVYKFMDNNKVIAQIKDIYQRQYFNLELGKLMTAAEAKSKEALEQSTQLDTVMTDLVEKFKILVSTQ